VAPRSWLALAFLIGPGSILALSAYNVAVRRLSTSTVATYPYVNPVVAVPYVNPVVAVILGATLLNERLTPALLIGGALIVVAVALVVWRRGSPGH
jgi:drug/metabolite transporter (DMT)-like permease